MFQMAAAISLAIDLKTDYGFDLTNHRCINQGNHAATYKNNIFRNIPDIDTSNWTKPIYQEPYFHFKPLPTGQTDLMIDGYFQSEKYFAHNAEKIREIFRNENLPKNGKPYTICLHERKGDYLKYPDSHPVIDDFYLIKATTYLAEKYSVVDVDKYSDSKEKISNDVKTFELMQQYFYYIISNSSFSWWASWLNPNPDKVIIAPRQWFGPALNHDTKDLYTENMIVTFHPNILIKKRIIEAHIFRVNAKSDFLNNFPFYEAATNTVANGINELAVNE